MKKSYGLPYMGSKNAIAEWICENLPKGERLVDLFGGGGAITHCASEKYRHKWSKFLYNDFNKLVVDYFKRCINGDYNFNWVSREEFHTLKLVDSVVAFCYSFGNHGDSYLYGKNIENHKRLLHEYIINGKMEINEILKKYNLEVKFFDNLNDRKKEYSRLRKQLPLDLEMLKRIQNLERLNRIEKIKNIGQIEIHNYSYADYVYKNGDVVYCDIPYENCHTTPNTYADGSFNHKDFYNWAINANFPVYFSSYEITDDRFIIINSIKKTVTLEKTKYATEKIYWNGVKQC